MSNDNADEPATMTVTDDIGLWVRFIMPYEAYELFEDTPQADEHRKRAAKNTGRQRRKDRRPGARLGEPERRPR